MKRSVNIDTLEKNPVINTLLLPLSLAITTFLFYYPSLYYPFQFDDIANISKRFDIREFDLTYRIFKTRWMGEALNKINYRIGGFEPFTYRLINVLVHIINGLLIFFLFHALLKQLDKKSFLHARAKLVAFLAAAIFSLHPVQSQAVSYVIQARLEGLATCMILLTLLTFVHVVRAMKEKIAWKQYLLTPVMMALAFLSFSTKEIVIIIPLLAVTIDWFFLSRQTWKQFKQHWSAHLILTAALLTPFMLYEGPKWFGQHIINPDTSTLNNRGNVLTDGAFDKITRWQFFRSEFKVILHYILIFLWPFSICVEYDWKITKSFFSPDTIFPFLILLMLGLFIIRNIRRKKYPALTFGLTWFFIGVAPRSSIIPSPELICDYKSYVASIGIVFILGILLTRFFVFLAQQFKKHSLSSLTNYLILGITASMGALYTIFIVQKIMQASDDNKPFIAAFLAIPVGIGYLIYYAWTQHKNKHLTTSLKLSIYSLVFLLPLGYGTYERNKVWRTAVEFWGDIVKKAPGKARAHNNYGVSLAEEGRYDEAIECYKRAIRMDKVYPDPWSNLAVAYGNKNEIDKAIMALKNALKIFPDYPEAYNNLGSFLLTKKDFDRAEKSFKLALQLRPWYGKAHFNLGRLYLEQERKSEAWESFVNATKGDFDHHAGFTALAEIAVRLEKYAEAIKAFGEAFKRGPSTPAMRFLLANCFFMTGDYQKSIPIYHELMKNDQSNPYYSFNLGEALMRTEDYNGALKAFNVAKGVANAVPQSHFKFVTCLEKLGDVTSAQQYLESMRSAKAPDWFTSAATKELGRLTKSHGNKLMAQAAIGKTTPASPRPKQQQHAKTPAPVKAA